MKTLIVIDMQNDFVTGPLGTPEARDIVPKIKNKIDFYKKMQAQETQKTRIIFTQDSHSIEYGNEKFLIEEKKIPKHCIIGTPGWCIVDELFPYSVNTIQKETFGVTKWDYRMKDNEDSSIQIVGVCTDICVISNALILRAMYPDIPIFVDAACCAGTTPEKHKAALEVMKSCCIEVINE